MYCCWQLIFVMTPGISGITRGDNMNSNMVDLFLSHPLASEHLVKALINTYIGRFWQSPLPLAPVKWAQHSILACWLGAWSVKAINQ